MAPAGEPSQASLDRFAAGILRLQPGIGEADTLNALFQKLRDHDFLPDPLAHQAILACAGRSVGSSSLLAEASAEAEERQLHREVEQFAAGFFAEPIASRVDRYRLLGLACARHPRLIERLRLLRPGLMIDRGTRSDPSPTVQRLLEDLLDLFELRPEARAIEARRRFDQFRNDPTLNDAKRARALKDLAGRHPEVVALLPDFPNQMAKPRKRHPAGRFQAKVATFLGSSGQRPYWILAVIAMSWLSRLSTPDASNSALPANLRLPSGDALLATRSDARIADAISRFVRDEFRTSIDRELTRVGKPLDRARLDQVVAALPVEEFSQRGGGKSFGVRVPWTRESLDLFVDRLKVALRKSGLGLTDAELDDLAPRCFPKATGPGPS